MASQSSRVMAVGSQVGQGVCDGRGSCTKRSCQVLLLPAYVHKYIQLCERNLAEEGGNGAANQVLQLGACLRQHMCAREV